MSRIHNDYVTVYLAIESIVLHPSALTERLGMKPDKQWVLGEARGRLGKVWESHGWRIEATARSDDHHGQPASQLVPLVLETFQGKVASLALAIAALGPSVETLIVLAIVADQIPGIELNRSFLKLLADLGGSFQVDLSVEGASPFGTDT